MIKTFSSRFGLLFALLAVFAAFTVTSRAAEENASAEDKSLEFFAAPPAGGTSLPFSEAVRLSDTLYVSGQLGNMPGTLTLTPGGIQAETRRALKNIKAILERNGSSMEQVVKCTVFLADMKEWDIFNEVYREFFTGKLPARSALAASGLALGARVEIECIAYVPPKK